MGCVYSYLACPWDCLYSGFGVDSSGKKKKVPDFADILNRDIQQNHLILTTKADDLFEIMMRWEHTVMQTSSELPICYIPIVLFLIGYSFILFIDWMGISEQFDSFFSQPQQANQVATDLSLFVTFFLSIALDYSVTRFFQMYWDKNRSKVSLIHATSMAKAYLHHEDMCYDLIRYMNIMTIAHFSNLGKNYNRDNFFTPITEFYRLLTPTELAVLEPLISYYDHEEGKYCPKGGKALHEIYMWCLALLRYANEQGFLTTTEQSDLQGEIKSMRQSNSKLTVWVQQPLPFPFINLTVLIIMMYLLLSALVLVLIAKETDMVSIPLMAIIFLCIMNMGLMKLTLVLNEPFKFEDHAFRMLTYCVRNAHSTHTLLHRLPPVYTDDGDADDSVEDFDDEEHQSFLDDDDDKAFRPSSFEGYSRKTSAFEQTSNPMSALHMERDEIDADGIEMRGMGEGRNGTAINPLYSSPGGKGKGGKGKGGKGSGSRWGKGKGKGKGSGDAVEQPVVESREF